MGRPQLLMLIPKIKEAVRREQRSIWGPMASEGYAGGYWDALNDIEALLIHGHPTDKWGFIREAREGEKR